MTLPRLPKATAIEDLRNQVQQVQLFVRSRSLSHEAPLGCIRMADPRASVNGVE
jgi:hypothetical protein